MSKWSTILHILSVNTSGGGAQIDEDVLTIPYIQDLTVAYGGEHSDARDY